MHSSSASLEPGGTLWKETYPQLMGVFSRLCFSHDMEAHCSRFVPFAEQSSRGILSLYALCPKASRFQEACSAYPVQKNQSDGLWHGDFLCSSISSPKSPHPGLGSLSEDVGVSSLGVVSLLLRGGAAISKALIKQVVVNIWPLQWHGLCPATEFFPD